MLRKLFPCRVLKPKWVVATAFAGALIFFLQPAGVAMLLRKHRPQTPKGLPGQVTRLAMQLDGVRLYNAGKIPSQVQTLVLNSLSAWLRKNANSNSPSPYSLDVRARMQLENDFSGLRYPVFGKPAVFLRKWKDSEILGAGYTLGWSDFDRVNTVALYVIRAGKADLAAITNFVPRTDIHYSFVPPSPSSDFRFIVYGNRLGKSQPRLTVALYSFDGANLKTLWQRKNLYAGRLNVSPRTVTVTYLVENEYIQAVQQGQLPPRHEAIYQLTPQGLALETEREIPFSAGP